MLVAWRSNEDGIVAMKQGRYEHASRRFRDAVARIPEPPYFLNLCMSLYKEGKFSEALNACNAIDKNNPKATTKSKADQMNVRIKEAARQQGITAP